MRSYHYRQLPDRSGLLAGRHPPDELGFQSDRLQIWFNNTAEPWVDPAPHLHEESDECFIVLQGWIEIEVAGERRIIGPREFCYFPAGIEHAVIAVHPPVESLVIRAPSIDDKQYVES